MKIAMGDVASVTRYSKRQTDGATGCVCLKNGKVVRLRNVEPFLLAQPKPATSVFDRMEDVFKRFDEIVKRAFG